MRNAKHPGTSGGVNYLKGMTEVVNRLNIELKEIKEGSVKGLVKAVAYIREETEKQGNPMTPYDKGNLKRSWFCVSKERVHVGSGSVQFKGVNAEKFSSDHSKGVNEAQAEVGTKDTENRKHVMFGYTMKYSGFVHEMLGAHLQSKFGRTPEPQWFQKNINKNRCTIVEIIKENIQIKK